MSPKFKINRLHTATALCLLILLSVSSTYGQGLTVNRKNGAFKTIITFEREASPRIDRGKSKVMDIHQFERKTGEIVYVSGLMGEAKLSLAWWSLFGEPTEDYIFSWTSSGSYRIDNKWTNRSDLAKYPDLVKRFDAIRPLNIRFNIEWYQANMPEQSWWAYRHVCTEVTGDMLLLEPAGAEPFGVPSIRQGKGVKFINQCADINFTMFSTESKKLEWLSHFNKESEIRIKFVTIKEVKWPVEEMIAIQELYEQYEKGEKEPGPVEQIEEAAKDLNKLNEYKKDDFWAEAVDDDIEDLEIFEEQNTIGIKNNGQITFSGTKQIANTYIKGIQRSNYEYLKNLTGDSKYFVYTTDNSINDYSRYAIIDKKGNKQTIENHSNIYDVNRQDNNTATIYIWLGDFKKVKRGSINPLYIDSGGNVKHNWLKELNGRQRFDYCSSTQEVIQRIEIMVGTSHSHSFTNHGIGTFIEYVIDKNLKVINKRQVYQYMERFD